jgi:GMP reductase
MYRTDKEYIPTPEGKSIFVDSTGEAAGQVVEHIAGGIRSACSYVGARNIKEFQEKCTFGTRHNKT